MPNIHTTINTAIRNLESSPLTIDELHALEQEIRHAPPEADLISKIKQLISKIEEERTKLLDAGMGTTEICVKNAHVIGQLQSLLTKCQP